MVLIFGVFLLFPSFCLKKQSGNRWYLPIHNNCYMQWPCLHRPQELCHVRYKSLLTEEILCRSKRHHSFIFAWFQASAAMWVWSAIFWDFTQRGMMVSYRSFEITCRSHLQGSSSPRKTAWFLKMGQIGCSEASVRNYHSTLRKIPKERTSLSLPPLSLSFWTCTHVTLEK